MSKFTLILLNLVGFFGLLPANAQIPNHIIPVAIIGSGCAGLSAAMVTSEYGFHTVVFTGPLEGGDLNIQTEVGNWPGVEADYGNDIMPILMDQAKEYKTEFKKETIASVDFSHAPYRLNTIEGHSYYAQKVIIATGTTEKRLEIPGATENREHLLYNWDIHKNLQAYLSSCNRKRVAIIGSGIDAMKKAFYAASNGAKEVRIFGRNRDLKIAPWRKRVLEAKKPTIITSLSSQLNKIERINGELHLFFNNSPTPYVADLVVVSIGRAPRSDVFQKYIKTTPQGFIRVDAKTHTTNIPGVFACGDVTELAGTNPQAAIAAGSGQATGYSCVDQLLGGG